MIVRPTRKRREFEFHGSRQRPFSAMTSPTLEPRFHSHRASSPPCDACTAAIDGFGRDRRFLSAAPEDEVMTLSVGHLQPIVSLIAGVLILVIPRLLNYIVAAFLIVSGIIGLGLVH